MTSCRHAMQSRRKAAFLLHSGNRYMMKPEKMPDDKKVKKLWLQRFFFVSLQKIINTNEDSFRIAKYCKTGT